MSLVSTPPPNPLRELRAPTMFMLASGGPTPAYIRSLYEQLPAIKKRLTEVQGSVYWIREHPREAAEVICGWFNDGMCQPY